MGQDDVTIPVARLVESIGVASFAERFHAAMAVLTGSELCSAFAFERSGPPRVILAEGWLPAAPAFAQVASVEYAREYWRRDALGQRLRQRSDERAVEIFRVTAGGIVDAHHRRDCYDRAGIAERLSLCATGAPGLLASGYRTRAAGPFAAADIERLERFAPLLTSALRRHVELTGGPAPGGSDLVRALLAAGHGLTAREAEVVAGLAQGVQQSEIATRAGLALSSIVTYRRRAYRKLGISDRRQLRQLADGLTP